MLIPVILSGGAGTRLWPVSREALPKPFIKLPDGESLLAHTLRRAAAIPAVERILTVTNREHYFLTRDEYRALRLASAPQYDFLLEPVGRNTAPAVLAAARLVAAEQGPESLLLILPADHLIRNLDPFLQAVDEAAALARDGWLVTFGVVPTRPDTGFGYIERGDPIANSPGFEVRRFLEKPDLATAEDFLATGDFSWNAGMFCFRAADLLDAAGRHAPALLDAVDAALAATDPAQVPACLDADTFGRVPDISIDYAIMEKSERVAVLPAPFDWSDVGSWNALADLTAADAQGNRVKADAVLVDSSNCYVQGDARMVAGIGLDNLLIIDTPDALLVAHRDRAQDTRTVVQRLRLVAHDSLRHHRTVHRPWGTYTVLEEGERFKMKRIAVKPGASLSLQMHHHRSEHWVVVSGTAKVVNGSRETLVCANESTFIPAGTPHRLMNPGVIDCVIIEVQVGDYLGEDDIVRFEDSYGRAGQPPQPEGERR